MSCPEDGAGKVQWDTVRDGVQIINRFINTIFMIMKTKLFLAGLAFFALAAVAQAQETKTAQGKNAQQNQYSGYRDADKDGICDNYQSRNQGNRNGNGARNGRNNCHNRCNAPGARNARGRNFVDENKNGICDRLEASGKK